MTPSQQPHNSVSAEDVERVRAARDPRKRRRPAQGRMLGMLGLLLVLAGPVVYVLLLDVPLFSKTGLPMWVLMAVGVVVSGFAWQQTRSKLAGASAVGGALVAGFFAFAFVELSKLPERDAFAALQVAPAFEVSNQAGEATSLNDLLAGRRALLLVFYRGHW